MPDIKDALKKVFGSKIAAPAPEIPAVPQIPAPPPVVKIPPKPQRTLPDITIAIQAQRIYNANLPPAPPTRPATGAMADMGTASMMGTEEGAWGNPSKERK